MHITTHSENIEGHKKLIKVISVIREYLTEKGYQEIDLPVLSPALIPESYIEIFKTQFTYFEQKEDLYLTPSPELFLKRLIMQGIGDCFYLGKSFRNSEPHSPRHNPEFTMLEFYKIGKEYLYIADEVLGIFQSIAKKVIGKNHFEYNGQVVSLEKYEKITVRAAFEKYAKIDGELIFDPRAFFKKGKEKGYKVDGFSYEEVFSQIYTQEVEPHLGASGYPTVIYEYPEVFAPLSAPNSDGKTAKRFEIYIGGLELGNCYGELTNPLIQKKRFEKEASLRALSGKINHVIDHDFISELEKGMPQCSGIAMGIERIAMIVSGMDSIDKLQLISIN